MSLCMNCYSQLVVNPLAMSLCAIRFRGMIAFITVISGFDKQTRLVGHSALYRVLLTHG